MAQEYPSSPDRSYSNALISDDEGNEGSSYDDLVQLYRSFPLVMENIPVVSILLGDGNRGEM